MPLNKMSMRLCMHKQKYICQVGLGVSLRVGVYGKPNAGGKHSTYISTS